MRYDPVPVISDEKKAANKERLEKITRKVAIIVALVSVYYFFIKLLFL